MCASFVLVLEFQPAYRRYLKCVRTPTPTESFCEPVAQDRAVLQQVRLRLADLALRPGKSAFDWATVDWSRVMGGCVVARKTASNFSAAYLAMGRALKGIDGWKIRPHIPVAATAAAKEESAEEPSGAGSTEVARPFRAHASPCLKLMRGSRQIAG